MNEQFFMPTKIFIGKGCIKKSGSTLKSLGTKAMVVTGKNSAKKNGSQEDTLSLLNENNISYCIFDEVESNPSIATVRKASEIAKKEKVDFIIGIGGGSPLDAAKAIAVLTSNNLNDEELFQAKFKNPVLPIVAVPTTAGTGSEVTPYSILTDDNIKNKNGIASESIFPAIAFLDATYTEKLPLNITINTAIDALSHSIEGYLSNRASATSDIFAEKSIRIIGKYFNGLHNNLIGFEAREELLYSSMLAGIVIAQAGTTALHAMGYSLTYFKNIDHGRANGLLMLEYLKYISSEHESRVNDVLKFLGLSKLPELEIILKNLLGKKEIIALDEIEKFSAIAIKAKNTANTLISITKDDLMNIFAKSFEK